MRASVLEAQRSQTWCTRPSRSASAADPFAGKPVAAEAAMPHGADEERHHAERRHADTDLRNREERRFGRDRDVAAGGETGAAADRAAVHDSDRWLRQVSSATSTSRSEVWRRRPRLASGPREARSAPVQKCRPLPRSTTMRTLSSAAERFELAASSSSIVWSKALPRSGRLSVMVAMRRADMSTVMVCSVICPSPCAARNRPTYGIRPRDQSGTGSTQCALACS